jgi:hypothetical protein
MMQHFKEGVVVLGVDIRRPEERGDREQRHHSWGVEMIQECGVIQAFRDFEYGDRWKNFEPISNLVCLLVLERNDEVVNGARGTGN